MNTINAKFEAQNKSCDFCTETNYIVGYQDKWGILDIRYDCENKQIDFMVRLNMTDLKGSGGKFNTVLDKSMNIKFCPMCGEKLSKGKTNNGN